MAKLRKMKQLLEDQEYKQRIENAKQTSTEGGWNSWFDGYPVPKELNMFLTELRSSVPTMKFYPAKLNRANYSRGTVGQATTCFICDEFSVYMDEYPFDLGKVGYQDYSISNGENTFGVYSRKITNPKYRDNNEQHHMVMTSDVKKAVKNACKYIVPYTHKELATAFYRGAQSQVIGVYDSANSKVRDVSRIVTNDAQAVITELMHLVSLGVTFKSDAFKQASEEIVEAFNALKEEQLRTVQLLFVRLRKVGEEVYVDIQEIDNVRRNQYTPATSKPQQTYLMSELPDDIAGSISVLSILSDEQYVTRVGQKIDENTYYIERG
jgi:hypothetical protein